MATTRNPTKHSASPCLRRLSDRSARYVTETDQQSLVSTCDPRLAFERDELAIDSMLVSIPGDKEANGKADSFSVS